MKGVKICLISILGVAGGAVALLGASMMGKKSMAVSIIGGADGPTSIFVAGKAGNGVSFAMVAIGVVIVGVALFLFLKGRKRKTEE